VSLTAEQSATLDSFLSPGEKILWSGRPGTRVRFGWQDYFFIPFGLFFLAFTIIWVVFAIRQNPRARRLPPSPAE
jgi:hypothetical protein